jgi:hypothetical protein
MIVAYLFTSGLQHLRSAPGGPSQVSVLALGADDYSRLLDLLLPVDRDMPTEVDYTMVLRFVGPGPESQITIQARHDGTAKAWLQKCEGEAGRTAQAQLARSGPQSVEELAKGIRVERKELLVQRSRVEQWHKSLKEALQQSIAEIDKDIDRFRQTDKRAIWLHGSDFDLRYFEGEVETHWKSVDTDQGDHMAFSRWMIAVRQSILAQR